MGTFKTTGDFLDIHDSYFTEADLKVLNCKCEGPGT